MCSKRDAAVELEDMENPQGVVVNVGGSILTSLHRLFQSFICESYHKTRYSGCRVMMMWPHPICKYFRQERVGDPKPQVLFWSPGKSEILR